ncbi:MAG: leucine-rich repeat protein [Oscillospiraceae bacterium]|nr:leucine-rich repeat protein [Oscillospiraceae bacterium]
MKQRFLSLLLAVTMAFSLLPSSALALGDDDETPIMGGDTGSGGTSHTHEYTDSVVPPSCTEDGYTLHTCACGDSYISDPVYATGHTSVHVPEQAPTCTRVGYGAGERCSVCYEILSGCEEIPAVGHDWIAVEETPPQIGVPGRTAGVICSRCGAVQEGRAEIPALPENTTIITITQQPRDAHVSQGAAEFSVAATVNTEEAIACRWQRLDESQEYADDAARQAAWADMAGQTGSTLRLTGLEDADALAEALRYAYRCVLTAGDAAAVTSEVHVLSSGTEPETPAILLTARYLDRRSNAPILPSGEVVFSDEQGASLDAAPAIEGYKFSHEKVGNTYGARLEARTADGGETVYFLVDSAGQATPITEDTEVTYYYYTPVAQPALPLARYEDTEGQELLPSQTLSFDDNGAIWFVETVGENESYRILAPEIDGYAIQEIRVTDGQGFTTIVTTQWGLYLRGWNDYFGEWDVAWGGPASVNNGWEGVSASGALVCTYIYAKTGPAIVASGICGAQGDNLTWTVDENGLLTISGTGEMAGFLNSRGPWYNKGVKTAVIESGATSIGGGAFADCRTLTSVTIPDTVTRIDEAAFDYCSALTGINIPASVTSIDSSAFVFCPALEAITVAEGNPSYCSIDGVLYSADGKTLCCVPGATAGSFVIPSEVTSIGARAFQTCGNLTSVTIPEGVTSIGDWAFGYCSGLTGITIPAAVTDIGYAAFANCSGLTDVTIPAAVTAIGDYAFSGCEGLKTITFRGDAPAIGDDAFAGVSADAYYSSDANWKGEDRVDYGGSLQWCPIPSGTCGADVQWSLSGDGVLTVSGSGAMADYDFSGGPWAFYSDRIRSVVIEAGVTKIGDNAFSGCSSLTDVTIPDSVTALGQWAFYNCGALNSVTIPGSVSVIASGAFQNCGALKSVTLSEGVTAIGEVAFDGCAALTSVTIPATVTTIGRAAFYGSVSLAEITLPEGLTTIEGHAFSHGGLTSITIPASVESIGDDAFGYNSKLKTITFLGDAPEISDYAFTGVTANAYYTPGTDWSGADFRDYNGTLTWPTIDLGSCGDDVRWELSVAGVLTITGSGAMADFAEGEAPWAAHKEKIKKVVIEAGVTSIGSSAFADCAAMAAVTIPEGVTAIGESAFAGCSALKSIVIPASVSEIGAHAFEGCAALTAVRIPEGVTAIGEGTFAGCKAMRTVSIPASVTDIGAHAFEGCAALITVAIPEGVTAIGESAFAGCKALKSAPIPATVTEIGAHAFEGCAALTSASIPEGVTAIGESTFAGCKALKSVTIPETVTDIGAHAFDGCTALTMVRLPDSVESVGEDAFANCGTLYIIVSDPDNPPAGVEDYNYSNGVFAPKEQTENTLEVVAGKTKQLTATSPLGAIHWSISADDSQYATVSSRGLVKALAVTERHDITVTASLADGSASLDFRIAILPTVQTVSILDENGAVVTGKTLYYDLNSGRESMTLTAGTFPVDALQGVEWKSSSPKIASVDANGVVTAIKTGTVTITAKATDGSKRSSIVKIAVIHAALPGSLEITNVPAGNQLRGGAAMTFTTNIAEIASLTHRGLEWSLDEEDLPYAAISAAGKLTTYAVAEPTDIHVTVRAKENPDASCTATITLTPAVQRVIVTAARTSLTVGETVELSSLLSAQVIPAGAITGGTWKSGSPKIASIDADGNVNALKPGTVTFTFTTADGTKKADKITLIVLPDNHVESINVTAPGNVTELAGGKTLRLTATVQPADAANKAVIWTSSDPTVATVSASGVVTAKKLCTSHDVTITATAKDGSVNEDGSPVAGSITLTILKSNIIPVESIAITGKTEVLSGKALTLKATLTPAKPTVATVVWSSSDPAAASVSAKGVVTAYPVNEPTDVTITASATDGSGIAADHIITVYPQTTRIDLRVNGAPVNNTTVILNLNEGTPWQVEADCCPHGNTMPVPVTWKSSSPKIASVDADGVVTAKKAGTVTITAKAGDGSGVTAKFKITVRSSVEGLAIQAPDSELRGGTKMTLRAVFTPEAPTNKKVTWSLRPEDLPYASINGSGVVTAKRLTGEHTIVATVTSQEDPAIAGHVEIRLYPSVTKVAVFRDGADVSGKTIKIPLADAQAGIDLAAVCYPVDADPGVTWKSSNKTIADWNESGLLIGNKKGSVTITATATDGSRKSVKVTIKII